MAFNYNKLWKILIDKGMKKADLKVQSGVSSVVIAKMGRGEAVTMKTLEKIALALHCRVTDIFDIVN